MLERSLEMNPELMLLFAIIGISVPLGLLGGYILRKRSPNACKKWTKFCLDGKWWLFLWGVILFLGLAALSFSANKPYFGALFLLGMILEAVCLVTHGFKRLSPDLEAEIDASDPTQIFRQSDK